MRAAWLFLILCPALLPAQNNKFIIQPGQLEGLFALDGQYDFYAGRHVFPETIDQVKPDGRMNVPGTFSQVEINGKTLPGTGIATLRAKVRIVDRQNKVVLMRLPDIGTAYRLYVNGELAIEKGQPGKSKQGTVPGIGPVYLGERFLPFDKNNELDLVFHLSNFHDHNGGIWGSILLAKRKLIFMVGQGKLALEFFLLGGLFVMAFYHLGMFLFRRQEKAALYFSFVCFCMIIRTALTGERLAHQFLPVHFDILFKAEYIVTILMSPSYAFYSLCRYMRESSILVARIFLWVALVHVGLVIFLPAPWYTYTLPVLQVEIILLVVVAATWYIRALLKRRRFAWLSVVGFLFLGSLIVAEVFSNVATVETLNLTGIGLFIYILFESISLQREYSAAQATVSRQNLVVKRAYNQLESSAIKIRNSEKRYRQLIEALTDLIFTVRNDGTIILMNSAVTSTLGYTQADLGLNFFDLVFDVSYNQNGNVENIKGMMNQVNSGRVAGEVRIPLKTKEGETVETSLHIEKLDHENELIYLLRANPFSDDALVRYRKLKHEAYEIGNSFSIAEALSERLALSLAGQVDTESLFSIRLGLREMIINAIEHGNLDISFDEKSQAGNVAGVWALIKEKRQLPQFRDRIVKVEARYLPGQVVFTIEDEGRGFDSVKMMNRNIKDKENIKLMHGRGIAISKEVFDRIEYNDKGNRVILEFILKNKL